ncbi:MAG: restriction endonuclease [Solirubrobacterales bacterium]
MENGNGELEFRRVRSGGVYRDALLRPALFVDRVQEIEHLASQLLEEPASKVGAKAFVQGPAGIGKTALISQFAHLHQAEFAGGISFLPPADLDTPAGATHAIEFISSRLDSQLPALVLVDEAADADPIALAVFLRALHDRQPLAKVILTSRMDLAMPEGCSTHRLSGLPDDALMTLTREVGGKGTNLDHLVPQLQGSPLLASVMAARARLGMNVNDFLAHLDSMTPSRLVGPDGRPLDPQGNPPAPVAEGLQAVNVDLVDCLKRDPDQVHALSPRQFEEFVAALYERHGFEVELTPGSRDNGVDLYAVRYEPFGRVLTIVECKRYAPDRPVGVELVRSLYGAIQDQGASVGVLATTSSFTAGARSLQKRHDFRLALQDWVALQDMLRDAG